MKRPSKRPSFITISIILLLFSAISVTALFGRVADDNNPPNITSIPITDGTEMSLYTYQVNAADSDGDTLSFSDNTTLFSINPTTGLINFTPTNGGNYTVKVTVSDGNLISEQVYNLSIKIINNAPIISPIANLTTTINQTFTLLINATDPDGDGLFFSIESSLFDINNLTGLINFTPSSNGTIKFNVTATDNHSINPKSTIASGWLIVLNENDTTSPSITIMSPINGLTITTNFTWLNVTTNESAVCSFYGYGCPINESSPPAECDEVVLKNLSTINGTFHYQNITDMKSSFTYNITIVCEENSKNSNNRSIYFYVAFSQPGSGGGGGGSINQTQSNLILTPVSPLNNSIVVDDDFLLKISTGDKSATCSYNLDSEAYNNLGKAISDDVGGAWKVGTSTKILEISENLESAAGTNRESIANITSSSFIDDVEMPSLLISGTASNNKGDAPYDQRLYFEDWTSGYVQLLEDNQDVTADFLYFPNGKQIARYELEFTTALESDVDDNTGTHTTTGDYLTDFEDIELTILGKKYTVLQARRNGGNQNQVNLILIIDSAKDTLLEGNTKTYSVDDRNYEVTLDFVDSDSAKFTVNGQATKDMIEGGTDKLSDGKIIGVLDVVYQDYAGGVHQAKFFIGTQKIELRDTDITDSINNNELKIDDETIDGAAVIIKGNDNNVTFKLYVIILNITADDDYFVPAGGRLSENPELDEPDLLFTRTWDIEYKGLSPEIIKEINIKNSGLDDYYLEFFDGSGNKANLPLIHSPNGSAIKFGDNDDDLIVTENKTIKKDDYFILTDESDENGKRQSFALRYKGADKITATAPVIKFNDLGSGQIIERQLSYFSPTGEVAQIKLGGGTFRVYNASSIFSNDFDILVDMDASGSIGINQVTLNNQYGALINITNTSSDFITVSVDTPHHDDFEDLNPTPFAFKLYALNGMVRIDLDPNQNHNFLIPENEELNKYAYSSYGARAVLKSSINSSEELNIESFE